MATILAVGVPAWPEATTGFDWKPLLMVLVALLLMRFFVGLSITWITAGVAFVAGTLWGWLIDPWGILAPTALAMFLAMVASVIVERSGG